VRRIYLDNGATTWPKPASVLDAVDQYLRINGATAGRGIYQQAVDTAAAIDKARAVIAQLIGAADAHRIVFTAGGTDSLNLALHGLLRVGDHVVTSVAEHNSVLRPLRAIEDALGIQISRIGSDTSGRIHEEEVCQAIHEKTRLIVLSHASNVTGVIQPTGRIGDLAREHGALFLIDAAQTAGQLPMNVESLQADLLAVPGHKGLLGPLGSGILYVGPRAEGQLIPLRQGGTGSESESDRQPQALPERMEAGNLNVPGIVGLAAGVDYLLDRDVSAIRAHHLALRELLCNGLEQMENITLYGPTSQECVGVVSFSVSGYAPQEVAAMLDSSYGIQVRAGYHCAADIHDYIGSRDSGGTVRISLGPFNDEDQIAQVLQVVGQIATEAPT